MLTLKYFSAVNGEASSALCLFVCSAIRGQGTIQGGGSSYFFIESKFLFLLFKHLSVSPFAEEKVLLFDDFRWPGFVREWKYLQAFRHWLTNTVRACIKIYYSLTMNMQEICLPSEQEIPGRMKIFTSFPPLVDNVWKIRWEHAYNVLQQTNSFPKKL